ncbi:MAG: hypothetical protein ACJATI_000753 [Halioglobus sp.]|jgi:hypothetical protein
MSPFGGDAGGGRTVHNDLHQKLASSKKIMKTEKKHYETCVKDALKEGRRSG